MKEKILVTGAGGFIGSHLVELLVEKGFSVKAFVRYNSKNNWGWLENSTIKNQIEIVTGDIRDYDSVYNSMKDIKYVFHLAALIGIPYSYVSPKAYLETNINGTYNILQAAKELNIEQILITSTSETYGTAQYIPIDEKHPLVGQSPYSATKIAADQLAISYYRSFNLPVKIVRPFNTFGPRQSARAIIPTIITQILSGYDTIKVGNLHPTRDLTYVKDTVLGFYEIFNSNSLFGEVTNIGMNFEISMQDLINQIVKLIGKNINIISDTSRIRPANSEVERLYCNNSKLLSNTNWKPKYNLETGLIETIKWIEQNLSIYKADLYNV
ncbi:MAG TPA: NAD-dependent 4,6-dehydratase LegB [Ignavibacteriales bacterium]|nr:NAD-dependent 4,6-dehydratase LegB [Ignavibacteriales bacterium]HOL81774.1 NAD-dependent 4,6-dehydratase LegB [Ignavibacteriales bacterium]HOM65854.1 NAD-dependent 4,6-dehydratase LegB [Ignavibacteriales bacterium]HPD68577.1 NAD-dependent 4,6-dehydratase LegB [Ignavibacteriales bacterium]HPP33910.1 NAD-dependent 4,6-dehydratase LegB [Ignavibacteriales bacterium]